MSLNIFFVNKMKIDKIIHKDGSSRTEIVIESRDLGKFNLTLYSQTDLKIECNTIDMR